MNTETLSFCHYCKQVLKSVSDLQYGSHKNCREEINNFQNELNSRISDVNKFRELMMQSVSDKNDKADFYTWKMYSFEDIVNLEKARIKNLTSYPDYLWRVLSNIKSLWLDKCEFDYSFEQIKELKNIEKLTITNVIEIPDVVYQLTNLKNLSISRCDITNLSDDISNLKKLRNLRLAHTKIQELPTSINNLNELEIMTLHRNIYLKRLPDFYFPKIIALSIHDSAIPLYKMIEDQILMLKSLSLLSISGIFLESDNLENIVSHLNLRTLSLLNCNIQKLTPKLRKVCKERGLEVRFSKGHWTV